MLEAMSPRVSADGRVATIQSMSMGVPVAAAVRLGLVGFGSVGRALAVMIRDERDRIRTDCGVDLVITGVATQRYNSRVDDSGLDLDDLLDRAARGVAHGPTAVSSPHFASVCPADIIVETLPLEPHSGNNAAEVIRAALRAGRSVVSANKGPVAHSLAELRSLAAAHGVSYRFESAVADGLPVFNLIEHTMPAAGILEISGALNSTSNVVLDGLAAGLSFAAAVDVARQLGITEADPSFDLEGWDAAVKLAALSAAVWGRRLPLEQVQRDPVTASAAPRATAARQDGMRLITMGFMEVIDGAPAHARVSLTAVGPDSEFYALKGTSLGVRLRSRLLCPISVLSHEPALRDTAYGLLSDILTIASGD
jgi:homoserine dehydrogenase